MKGDCIVICIGILLILSVTLGGWMHKRKQREW